MPRDPSIHLPGLAATVDGRRLGVRPEVQAAIDRLVAVVNEGAADPAAFGLLGEWIEEEGEALTGAQETYRMVALSPWHLGRQLAQIEDDEVRDALGLDDDASVSDEERLRCFEKSKLPALMEDADFSSGFTAYWLTASDGHMAIVVSDVQGYSFSEVTTTWYGPYRDIQDFEAWLDAENWLTGPEAFSALPLEEKLRRLQG